MALWVCLGVAPAHVPPFLLTGLGLRPVTGQLPTPSLALATALLAWRAR